MKTITNTTVLSNFATIGQLEILHQLFPQLYLPTLMLTDDAAARRVARHWQIALSGSLGCLATAVENQLCTLSDGNKYLHQMIQSGYYSPYPELSPLLK